MNESKKIALILIDIQKAFDNEAYWGGERNNPDIERNARVLLDYWRENNLPLFHIQHCSVSPGSPLQIGHPGNAFKDIEKPIDGETVIKKSVNSAFIGTGLKELLNSQAIKSVVIAGLTTDHCVSTTTRMAANYGFETFLVADATATFARKGITGEQYDAETMHLTALAHLNDEFAKVVTTAGMLELMNVI